MVMSIAVATALLVTTAIQGVAGAEPSDREGWSRVAPTDGSAPIARHEAGFVAVGDTLVLLGGRGERSVSVYDTGSGEWRVGAAPPLQLHHFQAIALDGKAWVIGAFTGGYPGEEPVAPIYSYDPVVDAWEIEAMIPPDRRRGAAGAAVDGGVIYLAGGAQDGHRGGHVAWLDRFDPATGEWTRLPDAPRARDHTALAVADGRLVLVGGRLSMAPEKTFSETIPDVDVFDLESGTWHTLEADLPTERAGNTAIGIGDAVFVLGGESAAQESAHAEVERLDLASGSWSAGPELIEGRHGTGVARMGDALFVASGSGSRGGGPELTTMETWSPGALE